MAEIAIVLLGGFRIVADGRTIAAGDWRRRKAAALVKLLALAPQRQLHREQLLETLWPDLPPTAAANNLRQALHTARQTLDTLRPGASALLQVRADRLCLNPGHQPRIDLVEFERAATVALRSGAIGDYEAALARYTGELLPDDRYADWAATRRESVRESWLGLLLAVAAAYEVRGDDTAALAALRRVVAADPTQEAARVGLMRLYALGGQRQQALQQYGRLREALRRDLDADPEPATQHLYQQILGHHFPRTAEARPLPTTPPRPSAQAQAPAERQPGPTTNVPVPLTSLIGRERELDTLTTLLADARLLTLSGPGGGGKTRLALALAARSGTGRFPDGIWVVELAPLTEPDLLPSTIAGVLGIAEVPGEPLVRTLATALRDKRLLLVLDNCEHLIAGAATLAATLLSAAAGLRVLTTSRAALRVPGEVVWAVPPLATPPTGPTADEVARSEAAQLFVARARLVTPTFALTAENAAAVGEVCRRLDGSPLAIELAATRMAVLTVETLAARLDDALGLLTGGGRIVPDRQRTLRATFDWSYALLDMAEQALLLRLAPCAGGWTIEAAEALNPDAGAALGLLASLVDKSLVQVEAVAGEMRYRLLETVRQYARERLADAGETAAARAAHAHYYAALAERAEPALRGPQQAAWLDRLERDHDNLRAALQWALDSADRALGLRLGGALWWFWYLRGYFTEGSGRLRALLQLPDGDATAALRAAAALGAGALTWRLTDYATARALCAESLHLARTRGDRRGSAWALAFLAHIAGSQGDLDFARACGEEGLAIFRAVGERVGMARTLNGLAEDARLFGRYDRADAYYGEALALDRAAGNTAGIALRLHNLTFVAIQRGDLPQAAAYLHESFHLHQQLRVNTRYFSYLAGMAAIAAAAGQAARAVLLYAAQGAQASALGYRNELDPSDRAEYERHLATARAALTAEAFAAAWATGQTLPLDAILGEAEAVAAALGTPATVPPPAATGAVPLSPREREVADLIAAGQTNAQIAAALGMARRTADTHVSAILRKLRLDSRAAIAVWARDVAPGVVHSA